MSSKLIMSMISMCLKLREKQCELQEISKELRCSEFDKILLKKAPLYGILI